MSPGRVANYHEVLVVDVASEVSRGMGDAFHPPGLADSEWGMANAFHPPTVDEVDHIPQGTGDAFHPPVGCCSNIELVLPPV